MVGFFLGEEDIDYLIFFLVGSDTVYQDLSKNDFFEILAIFSGCAKILD